MKKLLITLIGSFALAGTLPAFAGPDWQIIEKSRKHWHRNRMVVVLLGAATDVALALSRDDRVEDSIEIVAAAFDKWPEGGDTGNYAVIRGSRSAEVKRHAVTCSDTPEHTLTWAKRRSSRSRRGDPGLRAGEETPLPPFAR